MWSYLQNNEQILPYLKEAIRSGEVGEQSFGYRGFIFFAHEYLRQRNRQKGKMIIKIILFAVNNNS